MCPQRATSLGKERAHQLGLERGQHWLVRGAQPVRKKGEVGRGAGRREIQEKRSFP